MKPRRGADAVPRSALQLCPSGQPLAKGASLMRIIRTSCNTGRAIARLPRWTGLAYSLVALSASLVSE